MRFFNTEGLVRPDEHYAIDPLERADSGELLYGGEVHDSARTFATVTCLLGWR